MMKPTPTENSLQLRKGDFANLAQALAVIFAAIALAGHDDELSEVELREATEKWASS